MRRPLKLQPDERLLTGTWIVQDGKAQADATCERIAWLLSHNLQKVADSAQSGGWDALYRDPDDGRTVEEARQKYGAQIVKSC
jgi:hypothetical protein